MAITLVVYDLPNRDCAAAASNGELHGQAGLATYKSGFIDAIVAKLKAKPAYNSLRIAIVLEPDSLPNLVTNHDLPACQEAVQGNLYVDGITYAIQKLHTVANASIYLDIAHSGWLGWDNNMASAVTLFTKVVHDATGGDLSQIRGFATDTANYTPLHESYLSWSTLSDSLKSGFYQWNPQIDEAGYIQELGRRFSAAGFTHLGFITDTSRNGWKPVQDGSPMDRRHDRGNWCNVTGTGLGQRPQAAPQADSMLDAYLYIKPPGTSDGYSTQQNATNTPDAEGKRFDHNCDPTNSALNAMASAPAAGHWFHDNFLMLLRGRPAAGQPDRGEQPAGQRCTRLARHHGRGQRRRSRDARRQHPARHHGRRQRRRSRDARRQHPARHHGRRQRRRSRDARRQHPRPPPRTAAKAPQPRRPPPAPRPPPRTAAKVPQPRRPPPTPRPPPRTAAKAPQPRRPPPTPRPPPRPAAKAPQPRRPPRRPRPRTGARAPQPRRPPPTPRPPPRPGAKTPQPRRPPRRPPPTPRPPPRTGARAPQPPPRQRPAQTARRR